MMKRLVAAIIIGIVLFTKISFSQSGNLDSSFNSDGIAIANLTSNIDQGYKVLFAPGSKIMVLTIAGVGGNQGTVVIKYRSDGIIDSTYGIDGKIFVANELAGDAVLTTDGSIVASGLHSNSSFLLFKLNSDGNIDSSFGNSGFVTTDVIDSGTLLTSTMLLQSDGKIVLAATFQPWFGGPKIFLVRYTSAGIIDNTFGNNGTVVTVFALHPLWASRLARDSDDKIYLLANDDFFRVVVRYNQNGTVDSSFGFNGSAKVDSSDNFATIDNSGITVQDDGKICVTMVKDLLTTYDVIIARLTPNGILDNTFGNLGKVTKGIRDFDIPKDIALQSDHKIVVTGAAQDYSQRSSIFLIRYNVNGVLDSSFGVNGIVTTSIGSQSCGPNSMLIQPDGKIVITGANLNAGDEEVCTVRYLGSTETGIISLPLDVNHVKIFPNPFNTSTTITFTNHILPVSVQLIDKLGREVPLQYYTTQQGSLTLLTIDLGELLSGVYFLSVISGEKRAVAKVMVE